MPGTSSPAPPLQVCGQLFRSSTEAIPILIACDISSSVPGDYNITYSVSNSKGASVATWRLLTVKSICASGERLCSDRVSRRPPISHLCRLHVPQCVPPPLGGVCLRARAAGVCLHLRARSYLRAP